MTPHVSEIKQAVIKEVKGRNWHRPAGDKLRDNPQFYSVAKGETVNQRIECNGIDAIRGCMKACMELGYKVVK